MAAHIDLISTPTFSEYQTVEIATVRCGGSGPVLPIPPNGIRRIIYHNEDNSVSPCQAYQELLQHSKAAIIVYLHDDVEITDSQWLDRLYDVMCGRPSIVACGLGGALSLGNEDLYRKPYDIRNMARGGYASNQVDAEVHGSRFVGARRVAVLDAFCMAVKTSFLRSCGGWPVKHLTHHCLDLWLACEAARKHKQIWMVGAACNHYGGGSSIKSVYADAEWLQGGDRDQDHALPHRWLYEEYKDVLPIDVY